MSLRPLIVAVLFLAVVQPAQAQYNPIPFEHTECTQVKAMGLVRSDEDIADFCRKTVNGVSNGCDYQASRVLGKELSKSPDLAWKVQISLIHSFSDRGKPNFMPEGAMFAYIGRNCRLVSTIDFEGCKPRGHRKACP